MCLSLLLHKSYTCWNPRIWYIWPSLALVHKSLMCFPKLFQSSGWKMHAKWMLRTKVAIKNLFSFYIFTLADTLFTLKAGLSSQLSGEKNLLAIKIKIYDWASNTALQQFCGSSMSTQVVLCNQSCAAADNSSTGLIWPAEGRLVEVC